MINTTPLISIITVNYNNADGLRKTMQSVLDLEFKDYEYIIIDGGSSDDSVDVIKYYVQNTELKNKITFWCSEKDKGIYNAMNKGLSHANGSFINLMNSGDSFISESLNNIENIIGAHQDSIFYGAVNQIKDGLFVNTYANNVDYSIINGICSQAVLIPMEIHRKIGFYDEQYKICADFEFYQRAMKNGYNLKFINRIICNFDISGVSSTQNKRRLMELKEIKAKYNIKVHVSMRNRIKYIIRFFLPCGVLEIYKNIKGKFQ